MAFEIELQKEDVEAYVNRIAVNERAKANFLQRVGMEGANIVIAEAEKIRMQGSLARSIGFQRTTDGVEISSALNYAGIALEYGRKPGRMPPSAPIEYWVRKKLGVSGKQGKAIARAIQWKIKKSGTKKYREKSPKQLTQATKAISALIPDLLKYFLDYYNA